MTTLRSSGVKANRLKFIIAGSLFLAALVLMVVSATRKTAEFFITVDELQKSHEAYRGQNLRISGAVIGESIQLDTESGLLHFTIAHIPGDNDEIRNRGGLSAVLSKAVKDPDNTRLAVTYGGPKPDMLRDEAQAILTGTLTEAGEFHAEELLLKCPTKYEEALPAQVGN